jgi:hypothetical protein
MNPRLRDWIVGPLVVIGVLAVMGWLDHMDRERFKDEMREAFSKVGVPCRAPDLGERLTLEGPTGVCTYVRFARVKRNVNAR